MRILFVLTFLPLSLAYNAFPESQANQGVFYVGQTNFLKYTREKRDDLTRAWMSNAYQSLSDLQHSYIDPNLPTKIYIPGWSGPFFTDNCLQDYVTILRHAILDAEDCNFICVDWREHAHVRLYQDAASAVPEIGARLAKFIHKIETQHGSHYFRNNVHIIGFSLGAHIAGYTGKKLKTLKTLEGPVLGRITGLDPAGPGFPLKPASNRLDKTDANYVDVIHTNADDHKSSGMVVNLSKGFGIRQSIGHADFFVNDGFDQTSVMSPDGNLIVTNGLHSHLMAPRFFTATITPDSLGPFRHQAFPCNPHKYLIVYKNPKENRRRFSTGRQNSLPSITLNGYTMAIRYKSCERTVTTSACLKSAQGCPTMGYYSDRFQQNGKFYVKTLKAEPYFAPPFMGEILCSTHLSHHLNGANGMMQLRNGYADQEVFHNDLQMIFHNGSSRIEFGNSWWSSLGDMSWDDPNYSGTPAAYIQFTSTTQQVEYIEVNVRTLKIKFGRLTYCTDLTKWNTKYQDSNMEQKRMRLNNNVGYTVDLKVCN